MSLPQDLPKSEEASNPIGVYNRPRLADRRNRILLVIALCLLSLVFSVVLWRVMF